MTQFQIYYLILTRIAALWNENLPQDKPGRKGIWLTLSPSFQRREKKKKPVISVQKKRHTVKIKPRKKNKKKEAERR